MSSAEATTMETAEVPIPKDLMITVTMQRPSPDGTPNIVEFIPEASRRAIFDEYREMAWGIVAAFRAAEAAEAGDLDEDARDGE